MKSELLIIETSMANRKRLEEAVYSIKYPDSGYDAYLRQLLAVKTGVLADFFASLEPYRNLGRGGPTHPAILKITNLPVCSEGLELPPPEGGCLKKIHKPQYVSENVLTLFALHFGCPYSMFPEGAGLINNLIPSRSKSEQLTGTGANSDLDFHIENTAARWLKEGDCAPKALLLFGVMDDPSPPFTRLTDARSAIPLLSREDIDILSQPLFRFKLPYRWRTYRTRYKDMMTGWVPTIRRDQNGMTINAGFYGDILADIGSLAARSAVARFREALEAVAVDEVIRSGELLCIDNRVVLHARTPFMATFDDIGRARRWVQRLFVAEDLDRFSDWGRADDSVFVPSFEQLELA